MNRVITTLRHTASAIAEAFSRHAVAALDAWERVVPW